jgi:hypothetical protein
VLDERQQVDEVVEVRGEVVRANVDGVFQEGGVEEFEAEVAVGGVRTKGVKPITEPGSAEVVVGVGRHVFSWHEVGIYRFLVNGLRPF